MITGEYKYSLDDKGRLMIPAKMRTEIEGNMLILTRGAEKCLWLFPPEEWKVFSESLLASTSIYEKKGRLVRRRIIAPAQDIEIDKMGRIIIPPTMREYAGLKKECTILGQGKSIEVWDDEYYKEYCHESEPDFHEAFEELGRV
ncbi:MAG: division/cell wall cluster transcriptional repressor MraZ [Spirochaetales bacterium]|nr:division/cell wall cluster transcriptional repressor MraZ [Spirochaetales bacterium]